MWHGTAVNNSQIAPSRSHRTSVRVVPLLVPAVALLVATAGCAPDRAADGEPTAAVTARCDYRADGSPAIPVDPPSPEVDPATAQSRWVVQTNQGDVPITLDYELTPCTANSFSSLASQGYFDGTRCHRLVDTGIFILQCGDPSGTGMGGPGYTFDDELTGAESYPPGTVAMANSGANTNGSQFFLVWADSPLPADYTVFGEMDPAGLEVVNRIAAEGQDGSSADGSGRPNNSAEIVAVTPG